MEPDSLSPYPGFNEEVRKFFGGEIPTDFYLKFEEQADYDANKKKTRAGQYDPNRAEKEALYGELPTVMELENTDVSWVFHYFSNLLQNLNGKQTESSLDVYRNRTMRAKILIEDHEDGGVFDPMENATVSHNYTTEELLEWQKKVPYILQRLHSRSKKSGVHLLSVIIAYEKVVKNKGHHSPKPGEVEKEGFFRMTKEGFMGEALSNKHNGAAALRWIRGDIMSEVPERRFGLDDSSYQEVQELLDICGRVGIDLAKTNPANFNETTMKSLVQLYIPSNKEVCGRINARVLDGLKSLKLDKYNHISAKEDKPSRDSIALSKAMSFLSSAEPRIIMKRDTNRHENVKVLLLAMAHYSSYKFETVDDNTRTENGFYLTKKGNLLMVPVASISNTGWSASQAIVHYSGTLVLVDEDEAMLTYLTMDHWGDYVKALVEAKGNPKAISKKFENNFGYGKWEVTIK